MVESSSDHFSSCNCQYWCSFNILHVAVSSVADTTDSESLGRNVLSGIVDSAQCYRLIFLETATRITSCAYECRVEATLNFKKPFRAWSLFSNYFDRTSKACRVSLLMINLAMTAGLRLRSHSHHTFPRCNSACQDMTVCCLLLGFIVAVEQILALSDCYFAEAPINAVD